MKGFASCHLSTVFLVEVLVRSASPGKAQMAFSGTEYVLALEARGLYTG